MESESKGEECDSSRYESMTGYSSFVPYCSLGIHNSGYCSSNKECTDTPPFFHVGQQVQKMKGTNRSLCLQFVTYCPSDRCLHSLIPYQAKELVCVFRTLTEYKQAKAPSTKESMCDVYVSSLPLANRFSILHVQDVYDKKAPILPLESIPNVRKLEAIRPSQSVVEAFINASASFNIKRLRTDIRFHFRKNPYVVSNMGPAETVKRWMWDIFSILHTDILRETSKAVGPVVHVFPMCQVSSLVSGFLYSVRCVTDSNKWCNVEIYYCSWNNILEVSKVISVEDKYDEILFM